MLRGVPYCVPTTEVSQASCWLVACKTSNTKCSMLLERACEGMHVGLPRRDTYRPIIPVNILVLEQLAAASSLLCTLRTVGDHAPSSGVPCYGVCRVILVHSGCWMSVQREGVQKLSLIHI